MDGKRTLAKISTLILTAGTLAVGFFACVPPPSPEAGGGLLPASRVTAACPVETFLSKVHYLAVSPPFMLPGSGYQSAPPIDPTPVSANITRDLAAAFSAAPPFFRGQLCDLAGIYIDRTGCASYDPNSCSRLSDEEIADQSWGFRKYPTGEKYIATSLGLWKNGSQALPFDQYKTRHVRALLATLSPRAALDPHPPTHQPVPSLPNTAAMTILAVLAHEYGHALWFDTFVVKSDGTPNPGGPAMTDLFCHGSYYSNSWQEKVEVPATRWIAFGDVRNIHKTKGLNIDDLRSFLKQGNFVTAGNFLQAVYDSDEWASLLSAFSPDEDFVETYELYVLLWANPNLRSPIEVTGATTHVYDIPGTWMNRPTLVRKMNCFGGLPPVPAAVQPAGPAR
jgi:hypothetical protein